MLKQSISTGPSLSFRLLWYILIVTVGIFYLKSISFYGSQIELSLKTSRAEAIQTFCDQGTGFNESLSSIVTTSDNTTKPELVTAKIAGTCKKIRIDLGTTNSRITLLSATLKIPSGGALNIFPNIQAGATHDIHSEPSSLPGITYSSDGEDPYIVLDGDFSTASQFGILTTTVKFALLFLLGLGLLLSIDLLARKDAALFTVVLVGILVRFISYFYLHLSNVPAGLQSYWYDEATYYSRTLQLINSGVSNYFQNPISIEVAPGNLLYLSGVLELLGGEIAAVRLFNLVFLSSAILISTFIIANRLFSRKTALAATLLIATYPELALYAPSLLTEYLFIASLLVFIASLLTIANLNFDKTAPLNWAFYLFIFIGTLAGLSAAITRLVFLPVLAIWFCYAGFLYWKKFNPRAVFGITLVVFFIGLCLIPFFYSGYRHSGKLMIATGSGASLWLGSRIDTDGDEPPYRKKSYDTNLITHGEPHTSLSGDDALKAAGLKNIAAAPDKYALMNIKKLGRLTVGNSYYWFSPSTTYRGWSADQPLLNKLRKLFSIFSAVIVAIFSAAYVFVCRKSNHGAIATYATALILIAVYIPFLVNNRYGQPIYVLGSIFAAYTIIQLHGENRNYLLSFLLTITVLISGLVGAGVL